MTFQREEKRIGKYAFKILKLACWLDDNSNNKGVYNGALNIISFMKSTIFPEEPLTELHKFEYLLKCYSI